MPITKSIEKVSELIEQLSALYLQYGDLQVYMDVEDQDWQIDTVCYSTTEGGDKFFSLINW